MKGRFLFSAVLALASFVCAIASPLTPQQAKQAFGKSGHGRLCKKIADLELSHTMAANGAPTLYVFSPANSSQGGFVILSADDLATPILGYSDNSSFDPSNIPPQMQWWLDCCSAAVEQLVNNPAKPSSISTARMRRADREAIAPLCSTKWNQDEPYNDLCPVLDGKHAVSGCVATAMAQVAKFHNWPESGAGAHTYTFNYGGQEYDDTFDFGSTVFDWPNMLDEYSEAYTEAEALAVATLMRACGNACNMGYGPDISGTSSIEAAVGLIDYLNYDCGMTPLCRDWYLEKEWDDMIYGELAAGRPLMYAGNSSSTEGHAFVCDGYNEGFYHINWGWGGLSDGYFLLTELNPIILGIGGYAGGFNCGQEAVLGIQRPVAGSERPVLFGYTNLYSDKETYSRAEGDMIALVSGKAFCNYSTFALPAASIGLLLESEAETMFVPVEGPAEIGVMKVLDSLTFSASVLPLGIWKAYPVIYLSEDDAYVKMKYNPTLTAGYVNIVVTDDTVAITPSEGVEDPGLDIEIDPVATEVTFALEDGATTECQVGETYSYTYEITANGRWNQSYFMIFANYETWAIYQFGSNQIVNLIKAGSVSKTFEISIPEWVGPGDHYFMALCTYDEENGTTIETKFDVSVVKDSSGAATVESDFGTGSSEAEYFDLYGRRIAVPQPGTIYIERRNCVSRKFLIGK